MRTAQIYIYIRIFVHGFPSWIYIAGNFFTIDVFGFHWHRIGPRPRRGIRVEWIIECVPVMGPRGIWRGSGASFSEFTDPPRPRKNKTYRCTRGGVWLSRSLGGGDSYIIYYIRIVRARVRRHIRLAERFRADLKKISKVMPDRCFVFIHDPHQRYFEF